ncbi:uncharacterized protein EHS24_007047 [Apiotrichum porosum]|uniref:Diaminopimelate epimerase-like protein n=1 Tax=Apiotrichum porosum TaxID=105984 RepID=A0A427XX39_9TREE|nr:uncharacterized protein EHS24_007047 [Apiotrichum porosum]RSH83367.1 hypothetical protein EHS24_007047 [Apiotrichum porosum]
MATPLPFFLANAFATTPHGGNQAAVVLFPANDPRSNDVAYFEALARDFNLPMTAIVVASATQKDADVPKYGLRFFGASGFESKLCGHATLATSQVLFNHIHPTATSLSFINPHSGTFKATRVSSGQGGEVGIALPPGGTFIPATPAVASDLGASVLAAAGLSDSDVVAFGTFDKGDQESVLLEISPDVDLKNLKVDTKALTRPTFKTIITQVIGKGDAGGVRVHSRVFIPNKGIDEDPVTGTAHTVLAGYFLTGAGSARLAPHLTAGADTAAATLDAYQVSERMGAMKVSFGADGRPVVVGRSWVTGSGMLEVL